PSRLLDLSPEHAGASCSPRQHPWFARRARRDDHSEEPMKRAMMLLVLGGVLASSGCASRVNNVMQSWVGHHYTNLLMSWGPPSAIYEDGQGGRILVWAYNRQMTTPGSATTMTRA